MRAIAIALPAALLLMGCGTSSTVERTETRVEVTFADTTVKIQPDRIRQEAVTREYQRLTRARRDSILAAAFGRRDAAAVAAVDTLDTWESEELAPDSQPKFRATRNRRTGETEFTAVPDSQDVKVRVEKKVTDEVVDQREERVGWLTEMRGVLTVVAVILVLALGILLFLKSRKII